jgi:hypothetical protein
MLNADVKTGLRPISRRQFKKGGKVVGDAAPQRADRVQRAGKKPVTPDSFVNKDVKEANEEREGIKHIGGMKSGGRAHKLSGGLLARYAKKASRKGDMAARMSGRGAPSDMAEYANKRQAGVQMALNKIQDKFGDAEKADIPPMKTGGRAKKMIGGPMQGAAQMMDRAAAVSDTPDRLMSFSGVRKGTLSPLRAAGMKKGGEAKHDDVAEDKALIKKMVKPSARTGKAKGGGMPLKGHGYHSKSDAELRYILKDANEAARNMKGMDSKAEGKYLDQVNDASTVLGYRKRGGQQIPASTKGEDSFMNKGGRAKRATGGGIFSGPGYPGKVPGVVPGGRTAHATGGKARGKGKTAINIVINADKQPGQDMGGMPPMPPGAMPKPPGAMPVAVPAGGAGMPPGGMPMPPGLGGAGGPPGMPPMPPGGMPPMPRKRGGRTYRSYKDMDAGAGGAKGREEKTEIAKHKGGIQKA